MNLYQLGGIIVGVAAVFVGLLWLARRSPLNERFSSQLGEHSQAYDSYNEAKRGAEQEAQSVLELSRTGASFTREEQATVQAVLVCYGRAVIEQGWPAMGARSEGSPVVTEWGRQFRETSYDLDVNSRLHEATFRQLLEEQDTRIEGRRVRLAGAVRTTPSPLWFVLVLGAVLTVGWILLGANRRGSFFVQASAVASVTAMATASLLLVWFFDHPFADAPGSIKPTEIHEAPVHAQARAAPARGQCSAAACARRTAWSARRCSRPARATLVVSRSAAASRRRSAARLLASSS